MVSVAQLPQPLGSRFFPYQMSFLDGFSLTRRVGKLGLTYFGVLQSAFLIGYGVKEVLFDNKKVVDRSHSLTFLGKFGEVCTAIFGRLNGRRSAATHFPVVHGTLFVTSGIYGSLAAMHEHGYLNLNYGLGFINFGADALFMAANAIAIRHNVDLYHQAKNLPEAPTAHDIKHSRQVMKSAVLGIVSSICYIFAGAIPLLGHSTAMALVFGCIAVSTGGLKILYDFFLLEK